MLVLSRKAGEQIVIGADVILTVVSVRSDRVRLGISAPSTTSIHREEVWKLIQRSVADPRGNLEEIEFMLAPGMAAHAACGDDDFAEAEITK